MVPVQGYMLCCADVFLTCKKEKRDKSLHRWTERETKRHSGKGDKNEDNDDEKCQSTD